MTGWSSPSRSGTRENRAYRCRPRPDLWARIVIDGHETRLSLWRTRDIAGQYDALVRRRYSPTIDCPVMLTALIHDFVNSYLEGNEHAL